MIAAQSVNTVHMLNLNADLLQIFGDNYPKLQQLKKQYDPEARFDKGSFIPPE